MAEDADLWTAPFGREIPWQVVDDFLSLRLREHEHLEYREQVDPKGERDRFIDAVAAMANTGGTGLILIGVKEDSATDRPQAAWRLKAGDVRPQSLEQRCHALEPYVPVEIAWAIKPEAGQITLIRVPDFWDRPVFAPDRGILIRQGQSNVPASMDQLRWWFAPPVSNAVFRGFDYGFAGYFTLGTWSGPRINVGVTPSRPWNRARWDETTDELLEQTAARWYRDLGETTIGENLVQFSVPGQAIETSSFVRCFPTGAVLRHSDNSPTSPTDRVANVEALAEEVLRLWQFALTAVPIVLDDYRGPLTAWFAVSGFDDGLFFPARPRGLERSPLSPTGNWTKTWPDIPQASRGDEIAATLLNGLARAFGYRRATSAIREVVEGTFARLSEP